MVYDAFHPGEIWLDTNGNRIQAHGGSIIQVEGTYYWYGENKEKTDGVCDIWTYGIRCYASKDLYNWEDRGLIIPPNLEDESSSLHPVNAKQDRPHIIYNKQTKKFVCWIKVMREIYQTETVLTADHILGPYTIVTDNLLPLGMSGGDFDLSVAEDGKAYYYFERIHGEVICADLTDDYTNITGYYSTHFPNGQPPYAREAPAHFIRKGKHYLLTSGTTYYYPNPSESAIAATWHGPFTIQGVLHVDDKTNTSFHSQISCVFKVPGKKDLYIALADRWLPNEMHMDYEVYAESIRQLYDPDYDMDMKDLENDVPIDNTAVADYVWLPISFVGDRAFIEWKDSWKLEDYE